MALIWHPDGSFVACYPFIVDHAAMQPVWDKYKKAGIYYVFCFAHPWHYHNQELDLEKRDKAIVDEINTNDLGEGRHKNRFPLQYFTDPDFLPATKALERVEMYPSPRRGKDLEEQIAAYQKMLTLNNIADAEKREKALKADLTANQLIEKCHEQKKQEDIYIQQALNGKNGIYGVDEFLPKNNERSSPIVSGAGL